MSEPDALSGQGNMTFETTIGWIRPVVGFMNRLIKIDPGLADSPTLIRVMDWGPEFDEADDSARVEMSLFSEYYGVACAAGFLEKRIRLNPSAGEAVARHLSETHRRMWGCVASDAASEILSASYEACVFLRLIEAGHAVEFIPRGRARTPDLLLKSSGLLVECKDNQASAGYNSDLASLGRWIREQSQAAFDQMRTFDPSGAYCHVCCLDLPEQGGQLLSKLSPDQFYTQWADIFFDADRGEGLWERAPYVLISSFDFCHRFPFAIGNDPELQYETWLRPLFLSRFDVRLGGLLNTLYHSLGIAPFEHLDLQPGGGS
jgi:hypothetical protein